MNKEGYLFLGEEDFKKSLSLFFSGVYLTNYDIRKIGLKIGKEYPLKERGLLLRIILKDISDSLEKREIAINSLIELLEERRNAYIGLRDSYRGSEDILEPWCTKIDSYILELKKIGNKG